MLSTTFAGRGLIERLPGLGCEPLAQGFDFPAAERSDQAVGEGDAARLSLGETLLDELLRPPVQRIADLGAKARLTERHGISRHRLPIEPGCAAGCYLVLDGEV